MKLVCGALVFAMVAACSSKSGKKKEDETRGTPPAVIDAAPAADADPSMVAVPQPVAPGPYVIAYDCSHSNMPFGKGGWYRNQSIDLGTNKWTILEVTITGEDEDRPGGPPPPPPPTVTPVSGPVKVQIATTLDRVLGGGPYRPEYPVPEGVPCRLTVSAAGAVVFAIDKADTKEADLVSELVELLRKSAGR